MAITLIKGRPGSGKSYECVVHHILPNLKQGRKVVTNVPLNIDQFVLVLGEQVRDLIEVYPFDFDSNEHFLGNPEDYKSYQDWRNTEGQGCLFVLDECHLLFPLQGRGKGHDELASEQIKFFSGHRHYGFDFIFMTQSDRKINKLLREDIEICIELRKNRAIGDSNYRRYVYYYGDGKRSGLIEQGSRSYEKKFFNFYSSHTKSQSSVTEANVKDLKKWHQSWTIRIFVIFIVIGVFKLTGNMMTLFSEKDAQKTNTSPSIGSSDTPTKELVSPKTNPNDSSSRITSFKDSEVPFGKFEIFIDGYTDYSYTDDNGLLHVKKQVSFLAINKAQYELSLHLEDFYLAGYEVIVFGRCFVKLNYQEVERLIYCRGKKPDHSNPPSAITDLTSF